MGMFVVIKLGSDVNSVRRILCRLLHLKEDDAHWWGIFILSVSSCLLCTVRNNWFFHTSVGFISTSTMYFLVLSTHFVKILYLTVVINIFFVSVNSCSVHVSFMLHIVFEIFCILFPSTDCCLSPSCFFFCPWFRLSFFLSFLPFFLPSFFLSFLFLSLFLSLSFSISCSA